MENLKLAVFKNDRDAKAGFLSMLFHVIEHDTRIEGKPFTWSTLVKLDGGEPYFTSDPGTTTQILTEEFNARYEFI